MSTEEKENTLLSKLLEFISISLGPSYELILYELGEGNKGRVAQVERTFLILDTGERIPVSRRYYQTLIEQYIDFMK